MPIFPIECEMARIVRSRTGGGFETRTLEVEGPAEGGGRNRVCLVFSSVTEPERPTVGYVTESEGEGVSLLGWLPASEFEAYRAVIAAGGPVQVHYETRDDSSGYVRWLALGRADEVVIAMGAWHPHDGCEPRQPAIAMPL